eukprot:m.30317 g.30317  ORF g.30317 m.30317 type:complete len:502 (-) comp16259_c0_seq1:592-2097(-)
MCRTEAVDARIAEIDTKSTDHFWSDVAWKQKDVKDRSGSGNDIAQMQPVIPKGLPEYTLSDVAKHCTRDDAWVVIANGVYDVTKFHKNHPGGGIPLVNLAGRDATDVFYAFHPEKVVKSWLPMHCIGSVVKPSPTPLQRDFRKLREELIAGGYFKSSGNYFLLKCLGLLPILALAVIAVGVYGYRITGGCLLGLYWQQLAFIGHDSGHNAVTHDKQTDYWIGLIHGPLLSGISISWWKDSHNVHHVSTNSIGHDPDIQHLPFLAVHEKFFDSVYSFYHMRELTYNAFSRFFVSYQHWLYVLIMSLARWNLYVQSFLHLHKHPEIKNRKIEFACMIAFFSWVTALAMTLPTWADFCLFVMVANATSGILHIQITISHFSMANYEGIGYTNEEDDFLNTQLATTMNVSCPRWMDWFHGGLQFQIEHHLFPRVPRHNLRVVRDALKQLVAKHNLPYHEAPFHGAFGETISRLHMAALAARGDSFKGDKHRPSNTMVWEAMCAQG